MLDVSGMNLDIAGLRSPHCDNAPSKPGWRRRWSRSPPVFCNQASRGFCFVSPVGQG